MEKILQNISPATLSIFRTLFYFLFLVLGFLIQDAWRNASVLLTQINSDLVEIKVHLKEVDTRFMSEDKIRTLIQSEIIKMHYELEHKKLKQDE